MSMTFDQVADLLGFCALHDKRKGDSNDVDAWLVVANDFGWTWDAAFRVAREHYGQGSDRPRLEAPAITDRIRAIRKRAAETFEADLPRIPEHVSDAEYPAWLRSQRDRHVAALVDAWAATGEEPPAQLPPGPPPNQLGQRRIAELTAGAFQAIPSAADVNGQPPTADGMQARSSAFALPCPYCSARPGEPCTRSSAGGRVRISKPHPARLGHAATEEAS